MNRIKYKVLMILLLTTCAIFYLSFTYQYLKLYPINEKIALHFSISFGTFIAYILLRIIQKRK